MKDRKNILGNRKQDGILIFLMLAYVLLLIWVVLFKTHFELPPVRPNRTLNLIPFYDEGPPAFAFLAWEPILNVLVFIPMGLYLLMLGFGAKIAVLCGFLTSLCFEIIQFSFAIGIADITDLITNTTGTGIGVLSYLLFCKVCKDCSRMYRNLKNAAMIFTGLALSVFFLLLIGDI